MIAVAHPPRPSATHYRVWLREGPFGELAWKRLAFMLLVPLPIAAACVAFGYGIVGLGVFALGLWPLPFRCRVDAMGVHVSWLLVSQSVPWTSIEAVRLEDDTRRWVIGRRRPVLVLRRHDRTPLSLWGNPDVLAALAREAARFVPDARQPFV